MSSTNATPFAAPRWRRLAVVAAALALAAPLGLGADRAEAGAGSQSPFVPLRGSAFYPGVGSLDFSGQVHLVLSQPPGAVPPNPIRVHTNLVRAVGTNASPGQSCRAQGAQDFELAPSQALAFTGSYRFQPVDPCRALGELVIDYRLALDGEGNMQEAAAEVVSPVT